MRVTSLLTIVGTTAILAGAVGCSDDESNTTLNPEGPPQIRQVFLSERVMVDTDGDGTPDVTRTRVQMAYGDHPDIPPEDDDRDGVTNAIAQNNKIRIIIDELLDGSTMEEILCADGSYSDIPSGTTPDDIADCAGVDRRDCTAVCTQIDMDDNQPVGILDENEDGAADEFRFKDDILSINCGGVDMPIIYDGLDKTFWNPSGNQQIPAGDIGIGGLGPAIVVKPAGLRTGSNCTIDIDDSVVDKDGNPVCAPSPDGSIDENGNMVNDCASPGDTSPVTFGTQVFALLGSAPPDGGENVNVAAQLLLQFNLDVDQSTVAGNVELRDMNGDPVTVGGIIVQQNDAAIIEICTGTLDGSNCMDRQLDENAQYTIHVNSGDTGLLEVFGGALGEDIDITFTTGDMPPIPDAGPDASTVDAGGVDA